GTSQDHKDDADFLVKGCAPPPTTTTSSTTTSTTKKSTTTTSSTTSSSAPPTTTPTPTTTSTTLPVCNCAGVPFLTAREAKINNDADVRNSVGVNDDDGRLRIGKGVVMPDGTALIADTVQVGNGSDVYRVLANTLLQGSGVTIRAGFGLPSLPIV